MSDIMTFSIIAMVAVFISAYNAAMTERYNICQEAMAAKVTDQLPACKKQLITNKE